MQRLTLEVLPQVGNTGKYFVGNVLFEEQKYLSPERDFVAISPEVGMKIRETLTSGAKILLTEDQVKNPGDLTYDDFEINLGTDLELEKRKEYTSLRNFIGYQTAMISALDFFGFYTSYSELLMRGYNINDANRDELYLQIIDTEDEHLIELLQTYVETCDKIKERFSLYSTVKKLLNDIDQATTLEELSQIKDSYSF